MINSVIEVERQLASTSDNMRFSGLAGKSAFEEALVDSLADQYADFRVEIKPYFYTAIGMREGDLVGLELFRLLSRVVALCRTRFLLYCIELLLSFTCILFSYHMCSATGEQETLTRSSSVV